MFKLISEITYYNNKSYQPPTLYVDKELSYPPTYFVEIDSYGRFLAKEEMVLIVLGYVQQILSLVRELDRTIKALNTKQSLYIKQNLQNNQELIDFLCAYDEGVITTNDGAEAIAKVVVAVGNITIKINDILKKLNNKFGNIYTYYDGDYKNIQSFANNLKIENNLLPLSYFEV